MDETNLNFLQYPHPRVNWDKYGDMLRNKIQTDGKVRIAFLSLHDLYTAMNDLGIDPKEVWFKDGYAIVRDNDSASCT